MFYIKFTYKDDEGNHEVDWFGPYETEPVDEMKRFKSLYKDEITMEVIRR